MQASIDTNLTVLVADDYLSMRAVIKVLLGKIGFTNVLEAEDGLSAMRIVFSDKVDLLISDWNMPKMPGIELLHTIRASEEHKALPFLLVAAEGVEDELLAAVVAAGGDYIIKPFNLESLREKIAGLLAAAG